jgi:Ring finger domain
MPDTRANFETDSWLNDATYDIDTVFNRGVDFWEEIREGQRKQQSALRKFSAALDSKKKELAQTVKDHKAHLVQLQSVNSDLVVKCKGQERRLRQRDSDQSHRLKYLRREKETLKRHNDELAADLEEARRQLDQVRHLRCDICLVTSKEVVTRCGHGFCKTCLNKWFGTNETQRAHGQQSTHGLIPDGGLCPTCRHVIKEQEDVWPIYLAADSEGQESPTATI